MTSQPEIPVFSNGSTEADESLPNTFKIPSDHFHDFQVRIGRLERKAAKLGLSLVWTDEGEQREIWESLDGKTKQVHVFHRVVVEPQRVVLNGWRFIATIEHTPDGNIVRGVPGEVSEGFLAGYRTVAPVCDHCKQNRARIDTYIVKHDDGRLAQVGSTCLKDFTGSANAEDAAWLAGVYGKVRELAEGYGYNGDNRYLVLDDYLEHVAYCIRTFGWLSKSKARELNGGDNAGESGGYQVREATAIQAENIIRKLGELKAKGLYEEPSADDVALAAAALEWARNLDGDLSDYLYNLKVAVAADTISYRHTGLAASVIPAYKRATEEAQERETKAPRPVSEWVGEVGQKIERLSVTVKKIVPIDGFYGLTNLHIFEDVDGNSLIWFASNGGGIESGDEGETLEIAATVKEHGLRDGKKQTQLLRVKTAKPAKAPKGKK